MIGSPEEAIRVLDILVIDGPGYLQTINPNYPEYDLVEGMIQAARRVLPLVREDPGEHVHKDFWHGKRRIACEMAWGFKDGMIKAGMKVDK